MLSDMKLVLKGDPLNATAGPMSDDNLYTQRTTFPEGLLWLPNSVLHYHSPPVAGHRLNSDLADLRDGTKIVGNDTAEVARIKQPLFAPGTTLSWPPQYAPKPSKYGIWADRYREQPVSPMSSSVSESHSEVEESSASVILIEEEQRSCTHPHIHLSSPYQGHPPAALDVEVITELRLLDAASKAHEQPAFKSIFRLIGEEHPFDPLYNDPCAHGESGVRSIDTANDTIYAPVPRVSTAAALVNFEVVAMTAILPPAPTNVFEKRAEKAAVNDKNSTSTIFTDSRLSVKTAKKPSENVRPWTVFIEPDDEEDEIATPPQQLFKDTRVIYETPTRVDLLSDILALLSMAPGPSKNEGMKQVWNSSASGIPDSGLGLQEMSGYEIYKALAIFPLAPPPKRHPTNDHRLSLLRIFDLRC
ncbi:hypothetical protein H0H87_002266 [Tephrocybe sp. NHM501043]|nr:hypothetical protein H0H87_002266 [Tephrocybe sp. NHM501043]